MDDVIAAVAVVLLAVVAFRRLRRVVGRPRRPPERGTVAARIDRTLTTAQVASRIGVAVVILLGVAWLTRQLFS